MKKSILFIADKPNWAYHFIIKTWAEFLPEYECYVAFSKDYAIRVKDFSILDSFKNHITSLINSNDVRFKIHSSKKYSYPLYKNPPVYKIDGETKVEKVDFDIIIEMAYYLQYTAELPFTANKKLVGLYTDCFPHEGPSFDGKTRTELKNLNRKEFYDRYIKNYDGLIVGSINLYNDYKPFTDNIAFANGIYLQNEFIENENVGKSEELTIGWTGTPDRPMKGFRSIIEPAIKAVQKTGRKVKLKTKFSGDYRELLTFYKDVDLVVIASNADTGPSLFSEASLCKVPSISTEIGFPKMVIKHQENGILINRDIDEMKNAIIDLYDNRDKLIYFSKRIKNDFLSKMNNEMWVNNLKTFIE